MKQNFLVYLCGPITGCDINGHTAWRKYVAEQLKERSDGRIECLSPMRHPEINIYRKTYRIDESDPIVLNCQRQIHYRDRLDVKRSDLVFANFLGATENVSIGSIGELFWADAWDIPSIFTIEDHGNCHDHVMTRESNPLRFNDIDAAIDATIEILLP